MVWDDIPNLDRAIALSDGYYNDPSFVIELYKSNHKIVMIQGK